ncbi:MAG: DUF1217 domain-containing protein [Proteobacteria bacterium]|nr:DUF1217 domain-containing protein [Pseudomonadota bacterium]
MTTAAISYQILTKDLTKSMTRLAKDPRTQREVDYYLANIGKVKTIDDFMKNTRLLNFAMEAHGLGDMAYAKGMIRKVLTEGVDTADAFAMKLTDTRFREFAQTFNFKQFGTATTAFTKTQQGTVDKYLRNALEEKAGENNEAVRLALYFDRKSPDLATEYSILADTALYTVVRTALGLPDAIAGSDIDRQVKLIKSKINIADFDDPTKRAAFIKKFLAMSDAKSAATASSPLLSLYSGSPSGVEMSTILSLQSLKRFGR